MTPHKHMYFIIFTSRFNTILYNCLLIYEFPVPGVPSLVSRRKMTLKLNYIYMKVL
jgi:hypothetical protein